VHDVLRCWELRSRDAGGEESEPYGRRSHASMVRAIGCTNMLIVYPSQNPAADAGGSVGRKMVGVARFELATPGPHVRKRPNRQMTLRPGNAV